MDLNPFLEAARAAARSAGRMLKDHMQESREIVFKGSVDLVTNFDRKAQQIIFDELSTRFPGHDFMAEEDLCERQGSEFLWIFDPLDGTTNFAHGLPVFCVAISLQHREELVLGVVYDPMRDEMFTAFKGGGAELNGRTIAVSTTALLDRSLLSTGFPYDLRDSDINNLDHFANFAVRAQAVRRMGSAAIDLCYVACGRFDGFWELKLAPWDVSAGAVIVSEAGGRVSDFTGGSFSPFGKQVLASNGLIHDEMMEVLKMGESGPA